jgi:AcrR family transcriptional regulator
VPTNAERSEATRTALINSARRLFGQRGFAATPTEDILESAAVSRGALYHHFRNKEDLFQAVYEAVEADLTAKVVVASAGGGSDALKQLQRGFDTFLDLCLDPEVQQIVLLDGPTVLGWETWQEIDARYAFGLVKAALDEAVRTGLIPRQPTPPMAHILLGAVTQAGMVVSRADDPAAAKREMSKTIQRLLKGLGM